MHVESNSSFAFLVVTYNHQDYILEHLESIKYLVQAHGAIWDVDLILSDDASSDQTKNLVDRWLSVHGSLFRNVKTIYNIKNLGTCASVNNMLTHVVADRCKLTAGDDVYSFENIFELTCYESGTAMVSGRALYLLDGKLGVNQLSNLLATATQVIYKRDSLLHRFKHLSYNNAPNLLYATECLLNADVREFLKRFDVVEDWPLQLAISREYPRHRLELIDKVLVYYRRTKGSTYIAANERFARDKIQIYTDLIEHETNAWERLRLLSRRACFAAKHRWANKLLNVDWYLFLISFIAKLPIILRHNMSMDLSVVAHEEHFRNIKENARAFIATQKIE